MSCGWDRVSGFAFSPLESALAAFPQLPDTVLAWMGEGRTGRIANRRNHPRDTEPCMIAALGCCLCENPELFP